MELDERFWDELYRSVLQVARQVKAPLEIARVRDMPSPPTGLSKMLFGLPVIVIGPSDSPMFRGQYVSHAEYPAPDGDEIWVIRCGLFSIMAVFVDEATGYRAYYPFAENGFLSATAPTIIEWIRRGYDNYGRRFTGYFEAVGNFKTGFVECYKSDILYLDRVSQGRFPFIIVDKYKILRSIPPSEFIDEFASLQYTVRELVRQKASYERQLRRLRLLVASRTAEYEAIKKDLEEVREELRVLLRENERLREAIRRRDMRDRLQSVSMEVYKSIIDGLERNLSELSDLFSRIASIEERITQVVPAPTPKPAPPAEEEEARATATAPPEKHYIAVGGAGERGSQSPERA